MRVLLAWPGNRNAGDDVIREGCINLLHYFCDDIVEDQMVWEDFKDITPPSAGKWGALIFAGTPFLWDKFFNTPKYRNALALTTEFRKAKKPVIFMGIGLSASTLGDGRLIDHEPFKRPAECEAMRNLFGEPTYTAARDFLASLALADAGVDAPLLACPSTFADRILVQAAKMPPTAALFFHNPVSGIDGDYWKKNPRRHGAWFDAMTWFADKYRPFIYTTGGERELKEAEKFSQRWKCSGAKRLANCSEILKALKGVDFVMSGRVHTAIPALRTASGVCLLRADSRAATFEALGGFVEPCEGNKRFVKFFEDRNRHAQLAAWMAFIKKALEKA